jgi:hypothetical protein
MNLENISLFIVSVSSIKEENKICDILGTEKMTFSLREWSYKNHFAIFFYKNFNNVWIEQCYSTIEKSEKEIDDWKSFIRHLDICITSSDEETNNLKWFSYREFVNSFSNTQLELSL